MKAFMKSRQRRHKTEVPGTDPTAPVALTQISVRDTSGDSSSPPNQTPSVVATDNNSNNIAHINPAFVADEANGKLSEGTTMTAGDLIDDEAHVKLRGSTSVDGLSNPRRRHTSEPFSDDGKKSERSSVIQFDDGDAFGDMDEVSLCYSRLEKVSLKDFSHEVRATLDIERYLRNMVLLINLNKSNIDNIIHECLNKLLGDKTPHVYDQVKSALFTHDSVHELHKTIRSTCASEGGGISYDQTWVGIMCTVPSLTSSQVAIARLLHPVNLGQNSQEVQFVILVLGPSKEKRTKSELEIARSFGTIFADMEIRQSLLKARDEQEFKKTLQELTHGIAANHSKLNLHESKLNNVQPTFKCGFMSGIIGDLKRRVPHYVSDYKDGLCDLRSITKMLSCTLFLYFACILPSIAFGVLNASNTDNILFVEKVLISQVFGGLCFAIFGGTPHIVLLTTAPLALYTAIIYNLSDQYDLDFQAFFGCIGLFNCFFLVIFSVFDLSIIMQYSTRSSEEIFALFISIAFSVDGFKDLVKNFDKYYDCDEKSVNASNSANMSTSTAADESCPKEISLLYLILLLGTLWIGVTLFQFKKTPYLTVGKREILADYALPVSVIVMTFFGVFAFKDIDIGKSFETTDLGLSDMFKLVNLKSLSYEAILASMGLGFCLSLLFFMDQNISAALVNAPQNKLKKGTAYHWDLLVIAAINCVLSLFCFPWVHAALPHSPLHALALADVEERVDRGHIHQIVAKARETRMSAILSHVLIFISFFFLQVLSYIPPPVLYGLFLYVAVTALYGNQMFERIQLFFTEQSAYPPNHYICRVPQRKIHQFTVLQLLQLLILCAVGFSPYPYLKMFFPVLIFVLIPIRHKIIPKFFDNKYLSALDGH